MSIHTIWIQGIKSKMISFKYFTCRRTRMHKWANPLAWIIRAGIAIALGALATMSCGQCGVFHFGLGRTRSGSNEYYVNLSFYIIAFVLPWVILMFPLLALGIQVTTQSYFCHKTYIICAHNHAKLLNI